MKFETIKKNKTKQIVIGGICAIGVLAVGVLATSRAKYRTTESFNIVNGTINYKVPDLNVVAMYTVDESNVETSIEEVPIDDSNYTYTLNTSKSACTVNGENINASIEYNDGIVNIGITKKGTKCNIYFDKTEVKIPENPADQTLGNLGIENPQEPTENMFASVATTDEGVFKVADSMYGTNAYSYYYRGAVTNNYVKFAGFCWRIIRINGDGSIRMIYDGTTCHANGTSTAESIAKTSTAYNPSYNASYYVGYTWEAKQRPANNATASASNLKTQTDNWYKTNITDKGYDNQVAEGKFCNDRNTQSGYTWSATPSSTFYYAARGRLESAKTPTLACDTGDVYTLKAGVITADEVSFAGGVYGTGNSKYYLYNGQRYWTMSPYYWYYGGSSNSWASVFRVGNDGNLNASNVDVAYGVRPVINLKADTMFVAGGAGTQSNPYVVS